MTTDLEARLGAEFNAIGEPINDSNLLDTGSFLGRVLQSIFNNVHWEAYYKDEKAAVFELFSVKYDEENVENVGNHSRYLKVARIRYDQTTKLVEIGVMYDVSLKAVEKFEPVMEWVDVDENHRERRPVLNKDQTPKMKKITTEPMREDRLFAHYFPIKFFVDLLTEIGLDTLKGVPEDYIPEPLGGAMMDLFGSAMTAMMMDGMYGDGWGPPFGPKMIISHHSKARRGVGLHAKPFRIFLKPEEGSDRMEVVFEPYADEEITANRTLIRNRTEWATGNVSQTATLAALKKELVTKVEAARRAAYAARATEGATKKKITKIES